MTVERMVALNAKGADGLCIGILRQIKAGSALNVGTLKFCLELFSKHR